MAIAPAHAVVIDLTAPTTTVGSGNGNAYTYTIGSGANQLQVRATAWSIDTSKNPDLVQNAILTAYSGGLGVQNRGESNVSPDHAIDNSSGWIDFILLQFDKSVDLNAFTVGWYSGDADATIGWGTTAAAWNISPTLNNQSITTLNNLVTGTVNSDVSSNFTGTRLLDIPTANTVMISARQGSNTVTDYFKVKSIDVTAAVPEPATWLSMIVGFGAIGMMMRGRRPQALKGTVNLLA